MSHNEGINPYTLHPERPMPVREVVILTDPEMAHYPDVIGEIAGGIVDVEQIAGRQVHFNTAAIGLADTVASFMDRHARKGQVVVDPLLIEMKNSGLLDTGNPVFLATTRDLTSERGTNFIFGLTVQEWNVSVQSVYRHIRQERNAQTIRSMARLIGRHEYGHLLGLDERTIRHQDDRGGLYRGHCLNECTMRQVMSVAETKALAEQLQHKHTAGFCPDCVSVLRQS